MPAATLRNPNSASSSSSSAARQDDDDRSPLLGSSHSTADEQNNSHPTKRSLLLSSLLTSPRAMFTQIACLVLVGSVLSVIIPNPAGLFSYHPPLQTFSIVLFVQGILTLQPTRSKADKARGLALHQIFQIVGLLGISAGIAVMIANKALHGAKHFTSWHGLFGLITGILLVVQGVLGALIAYEPGYKLFGGESKAKSLWKYHRASGYVILPLSLFTASLATESADWVRGHSNVAQRVLMTGALAAIALGLWSGVSLHKLGLKSR